MNGRDIGIKGRTKERRNGRKVERAERQKGRKAERRKGGTDQGSMDQWETQASLTFSFHSAKL
jgi:hypothetical protein